MKRSALSRLLPVWVVLLLTAAGLPAAQRAGEPNQEFHRLLDRPTGPGGFEAKTEPAGELTVEHGTFHSDRATLVPYLLVKPAAEGRLPAVIVLHGTGGRKEAMRSTLDELAKRGLLAIAIDARYHGDRVPGAGGGKQAYEEAILRAWREKDPARQEHPFYYDTVYDLWRTVDRLGERPDVDAERIGIIGFSMGGIQAWLATATDPRLKVVVPAIAVQSFRWSLEHDQWQGRARTIQGVHEAVARELGEPAVNQRVCRTLWEKIVPGILDRFDGPSLLPLIAPRPMLIVSGEKDPNCPLEGARVAFEAARAAYRKAGAADRLEIDVAPGVAHQVTPEQRLKAYAFLAHWLRAPAEKGAQPSLAYSRP